MPSTFTPLDMESSPTKGITAYSRRLLSPFSGQVQIAEVGEARALSLDGRNWEIQYQIAAKKAPPGMVAGDRQIYQYVRIAGVQKSEVIRRAIHPMLDPDQVNQSIDALADFVLTTSIPLPAHDCFEYWLLDGSSKQPLALIASAISETEAATTRTQPKWIALPAAQLAIPDEPNSSGQYVTPVNYRVQKMVERRAGSRPSGVWLKRSNSERDTFPPCLLQSEWSDPEESRLYQRYVDRLAPRLLTLQGLSTVLRRQLEEAARGQALEVEQFHTLYPEITDQKLINTLLVEASMRKAASRSR